MSILPIETPTAPISAPPSLVWRRIRRNPLSFTALCVIVVIALMALFAPLVAPYSPDATDAGSALQSAPSADLVGQPDGDAEEER